MSPILTGVIASGVTGQLNVWSPQGAYDSLASISVSTAVASVTFSGIPEGYKHLQIRSTHQLNTNDSDYGVRFNGDGGNNYTKHQIFASGSSPYFSNSLAVSAMPGGMSQLTTTYYHGAAIIDVFDYTNVDKHKSIRTLGGGDGNGSGAVLLRSGLWTKQDKIFSITLVAQNGATLINAGSQFALYGVK
jgi:hypothetical protein